MRNLKNIQQSTLLADQPLLLTATTWDPATDSLVCTFGPSQNFPVIELKRSVNLGTAPTGWDGTSTRNDFTQIASWDAPCPLPNLACDEILCLHYFADTLTACLVLAGGDIVLVREQPRGGEDKIEIVGSVDAGIVAAAWSPEEELLAIVTRGDSLLLMSREIDNVADVSFTTEDLRASQHVSVGWGKSETQFKGKRAKALRDPTMPEKVDEGVLSLFDTGTATISWRGDGAYVAINTIESGTRRVIRIFSRQGALDSVSEPVDRLEGALSWRPAGNLIAGIQRLADRVDVVFFERNGLRHGQFSLRLTPKEMAASGEHIRLAWNVDSTVLAVCFRDRIQLWTMGNYHYYLKQEHILYGLHDSSKASFIKWHPEQALRFAVSSIKHLQIIEHVFSTNCGPKLSPHDYGAMAVIDGRNLKLTPLRLANIPPPMALYEVLLKHNAIDVAFSQSSTQIAVLHEASISIFDWDINTSPPKKPSLRFTFEIPISSEAFNRQIIFCGDSEVITLTSVESVSSLTHYSVGSVAIAPHKSRTYSQNISCITTSINHQTIHVQCEATSSRGEMSFLAPEPLNPTDSDQIISSIEHCAFPVVCPWVEVLHHANGLIAFGLSRSGHLYANQRLLIKNCTSFLITAAYLIVTTTQHLMKVIHITTVEGLQVPPDEPEKDERCRSIERGARLITVMPTSYSLTLQMPRGNLETIYPRALVLAGIRQSIISKDYKTAFFACRSQRVDMNILCDYAPQQFLSCIELFVEQIKKVAHIDLFLSQLREEDVSETMYRETSKATKLSDDEGPKEKANGIHRSPSPSAQGSSKVNGVCDAFLNVLQDRKSTNLQNIITAHACKSPPDLEAGLLVIGQLMANDSALAGKAVEHICFLADVNRLYESALGLYDLELALLVAQQSQMDPREYLPFLQGLQDMSQLRRQFSIDNHLSRYTKALEHLHGLAVFDELNAYIEKHELYRSGLKLYRYKEDELNKIMRLYADYLHRQSNFKDAGIAYEYTSDYESASEAYRAANLWRESLSCANMALLPTSTIRSLAHSLADAMAETKDYLSAATIHLDYLEDIETSTRVFCKGYHFAEAMRILGLAKRQDLLEPLVDAGLVEGLASTTELLADCKTQLGAQVPRLRELRAKKEEDPLAYFDGAEATDIADNVSLAPTDTSTSGGSLFTRYTNRTGTVNTATTRKTSKNKRREERKRARGKKGSVYEEEYLVNSIGRLIDRVNSVRDEVQRLVRGLLRRGMRERAMAVEQAMADVVAACGGCVDEVFQVDKGTVVETGDGVAEDEEARPRGGDGVLWDSIEEKTKKREPPVVKAFDRLSLLGG